METVRAQVERMKRSKRSVRPQALDTLLLQVGFERRHGKGDHWIYSHPLRVENLTINPHNPLLPVYVTNAIKAIEEVLAMEGEDDG
jgi:predicted RNA binding protein YcfA (HicA-like mRNA interferase family)